MQTLTDLMYQLDDFMWGTWMTILLLGVGIVLSIRFAFRYQRKIAFNFKNTYGKIGAKGEGEGTVSGFRAACTALANTVGTGNISGVATAIVSGGPGALVWMWVSAFFGMSTKACEIIIGQRYREHYKKSMNEYVCDRSFVLKNAFGWKKGAVVLAVFCFLFGPWTCFGHRHRHHLPRDDLGRPSEDLRRHVPRGADHGGPLYRHGTRRAHRQYQPGPGSRGPDL